MPRLVEYDYRNIHSDLHNEGCSVADYPFNGHMQASPGWCRFAALFVVRANR